MCVKSELAGPGVRGCGPNLDVRGTGRAYSKGVVSSGISTKDELTGDLERQMPRRRRGLLQQR